MATTGYISPIAIHPGGTIKETLDVLGVSQADLSVRTGLAEKTISEIMNGKNPVTPETALKLERTLGISRIGLINMQAQYDADFSRLKEEKRLQEETKHLKNFSCYPELVERDLVKKTRNEIEKVEELLRFFAVDSLTSVRKVLPVAFHKAKAKKVNEESLAAWLKIGEIRAQKIATEEFDENKLKENLPKMRALTKEKADDYAKKLIELCAPCGIALVYVPHLKNTHVFGATRWLTPKKALVQLSLLYKHADSFWFSFFHEIGHILKHSKKEMFVDFEGGKDTSEMEQEASEFAQKILIPSKANYVKFRDSLARANLKQSLLSFSESIDIDPGIVAGRIGRETGRWEDVEQFRRKLRFRAK